MANLTASNAANFGGGTPIPNQVFNPDSRLPPVDTLVLQRLICPQGAAAVPIVRRGAGMSAAARTENAAGITPTALATPTSSVATPAYYGIATGISTPAINRAGPNIDIQAMSKGDAALACAKYLITDETVGLHTEIAALSKTVGNSSSRLSLATIKAGAALVWPDVGDTEVLVCVINGIGYIHVEAEISASGSPNVSLDPGVPEMFRPFFTEGDGRWAGTIMGGRIAILVQPHSSYTYSSGGAYYGYICKAPRGAMPGLADGPQSEFNAGSEGGVEPAFAIGYYESPAAGPEMSGQQVETVQTAVGPLAAVTRSASGANTWEIDYFASGDVITAYGAAACQILYQTAA